MTSPIRDRPDLHPREEEWLQDFTQLIEKIEIDRGDPTFFHFHIMDEGGQRTITLTDSQLLTSKEFELLFFRYTLKRLDLSKKQWDAFIFDLIHCNGSLDKKVEKHLPEEFSFEQDALDVIVMHLALFVGIADKSDLRRNYRYVFYEKERKCVLVPTASIKKILELERINLSLEKLRILLKPKLKEKTGVITCKGQSVRVWVFKDSAFENLKVIDLAEEREEMIAQAKLTPKIFKAKQDMPAWTGMGGEKFEPLSSGQEVELPQTEWQWARASELFEEVKDDKDHKDIRKRGHGKDDQTS